MKKYLFILCLTTQTLFSQWIQISGMETGDVRCLTVLDTNLFAGTMGEGVFLSKDKGSNWTAVNTGLTNLRVNAICVLNAYLFAGTDSGIFLSTNNGATWAGANSGLPISSVTCFAVSDTTLFTGTWGEGVFRSTNNGASWTSVNAGLELPNVHTLIFSETNLYAGTSEMGTSSSGVIFRLNCKDSIWIDVGLHREVISFSILNGKIFAGTTASGYPGGLVFLNTSTDLNWQEIFRGAEVRALATTVKEPGGINLFVGTNYAGVILMSYNGENWSKIDTGFTGKVNAFAVLGSNLYAGTSGKGIWRRSLANLVSVNRPSASQPIEFSLSQNYPNPFNPSTKIRYSLPSSANVKLSVYDLLGREIATLVNEEQSVGWKEVQWDASNFASGMYLVRMQAGGFVETRKMLLIK